MLVPSLRLPSESVLLSSRLQPGRTVVAAVEHALTVSRVTVLVLSPAFLHETWSSFGELLASHHAVSSNGLLVPLVISDCDLPPRLDMWVCLDLRAESQRHTELARLRRLLRDDLTFPIAARERSDHRLPRATPIHLRFRARFGVSFLVCAFAASLLAATLWLGASLHGAEISDISITVPPARSAAMVRVASSGRSSAAAPLEPLASSAPHSDGEPAALGRQEHATLVASSPSRHRPPPTRFARQTPTFRDEPSAPVASSELQTPTTAPHANAGPRRTPLQRAQHALVRGEHSLALSIASPLLSDPTLAADAAWICAMASCHIARLTDAARYAASAEPARRARFHELCENAAP